MANPQKENGRTEIANEILEKFCRFRIPGEVMQVVMVIIRKTYGWHKKTDQISYSQFSQMTGLSKSNVARALSKASTHCLIYKDRTGKYGFQKDFDGWIEFGVLKSDLKVIKSDNKPHAQKLSKASTTKEIKETIQKKGFKDLSFINLEPIEGCDF